MLRYLARRGGNFFNRVRWKLQPYRFSSPYFPPASEELTKPLLIACQPGFDQDFPIAGSLMRVGFANGWAEACGPAKLVPISKLIRELDKWEKPAVFMCAYDFNSISDSEARLLRGHDLFVWIGTHPDKLKDLEKHPLVSPADKDIMKQTRGKILLAQPKFVWNSTCASAMHWYQGWLDDGLTWVTLHPAVDVRRYFPVPKAPEFAGLKMAYVGGYWPEKAQAFDMYLRPWEDIFTPYGYAKWPYKHYGGQLGEAEERQLYSSAGLIPLVTTPMGWDIGEITERYLKAPACRAFCIADQNPALRDIFSAEEMLQAGSPEHFHGLVRDYLSGKIDVAGWSQKGYEAVMGKHLYRHRALQISRALSGVLDTRAHGEKSSSKPNK